MGEKSAIAWTEATFNPWVGCSKVSAGCTNCYAERDFAIRRKFVEWGPGKPRRRTSEAYWKQPLKWDRQAAKDGVRRKVFCASLADVFDQEVDDSWRDDLFALIRRTPHLDWLILTKRPERAKIYLEGGCTFCFGQGSLPVEGGGKPCGACLIEKNGLPGLRRDPIGSLPNVWLGVSV